MTTYIRPGGVWRDVPPEFVPAVQEIVNVMPGRIAEYESMLTQNMLFTERTQGIGVISAEDCARYGLSGPIIRGSGVAFDLRKAQPYSGYEQYVYNGRRDTTRNAVGKRSI